MSRAVASPIGPQLRRRILFLVVFVLIVVSGLVAQLVRLQLFAGARYVEYGEQMRDTVIELPGERGRILDRNGEELAVTMPNPVIAADPALIEDPRRHAEWLAPVLGEDPEVLEAKLSGDSRFVYLDRPSDPTTAAAVVELGLGGVLVYDEPLRINPGGELARSVIGGTNIDGDGSFGLEEQYQDVLDGTPGEQYVERSNDGGTIPGTERVITPAAPGADLCITIDATLQFQVEESLIAALETTNGQAGTVIVTDPATGEILAMASAARDVESGTVGRADQNLALTWVYEPASVMKALTFSAVLDQGLADPTSARDVPDQIQLYDEVFEEDEVFGTRRLTTTDILVRSSNTGTILWAQDLGATRLDDYLRRFGLGSYTGLDFPREEPGLFPDLGAWSGTSIATIALGQGISVTPMQMLAAYNTIANGGLYVEPRLVGCIADESGSRTPPSTPARRVIREETADAVAGMLSRVVADGTARRAQVPGYEIAAKTGTAQKAQAEGGYLDEFGAFHYVATVAGFFPANDPRFSMIVVIDEPTPEFYASRVSAPLFGELAAWTLRHYQIQPTTDLVFAGEAAPEPTPMGERVAAPPAQLPMADGETEGADGMPTETVDGATVDEGTVDEGTGDATDVVEDGSGVDD